MKLTTDIIINSLKDSLLEISLAPIRQTYNIYRKLFYKDYKLKLLNLEQEDLFQLINIIFINQSISVNNETTKGTDRISISKIGALVRNPIYNDILILAGEKQSKLTDEEVKTIIDNHVNNIKLSKTKNQTIDILKYINEKTFKQ